MIFFPSNDDPLVIALSLWRDNVFLRLGTVSKKFGIWATEHNPRHNNKDTASEFLYFLSKFTNLTFSVESKKVKS